MQLIFTARRGRRVFQRFNLQQTATLSTRVPIAVSHVRRVFRLADRRIVPLAKGTNYTVERFLTAQSRQYSAPAVTESHGKTKKATRKGSKKATKKKATKKEKKKLTPEQVEKKKARQRVLQVKEEIKELKVKSLRKEEPKLTSPVLWSLYLKQKLQGQPHAELTSTFKKAAEEFRSLSSFQRQELEHQSANIKEENKRKYAEWLNSYTPLQIKTANQARKRLVQVTAEHRKHVTKYPLIRDDRLVKMPVNPFSLFFKERAQREDLSRITSQERLAQTITEWKGLSDSEKEHYSQLAAEDKKRYISEYVDVYGEEPVTVKKATPKAASTV